MHKRPFFHKRQGVRDGMRQGVLPSTRSCFQIGRGVLGYRVLSEGRGVACPTMASPSSQPWRTYAGAMHGGIARRAYWID